MSSCGVINKFACLQALWSKQALCGKHFSNSTLWCGGYRRYWINTSAISCISDEELIRVDPHSEITFELLMNAHNKVNKIVKQVIISSQNIVLWASPSWLSLIRIGSSCVLHVFFNMSCTWKMSERCWTRVFNHPVVKIGYQGKRMSEIWLNYSLHFASYIHLLLFLDNCTSTWVDVMVTLQSG